MKIVSTTYPTEGLGLDRYVGESCILLVDGLLAGPSSADVEAHLALRERHLEGDGAQAVIMNAYRSLLVTAKDVEAIQVWGSRTWRERLALAFIVTQVAESTSIEIVELPLVPKTIGLDGGYGVTAILPDDFQPVARHLTSDERERAAATWARFVSRDVEDVLGVGEIGFLPGGQHFRDWIGRLLPRGDRLSMLDEELESLPTVREWLEKPTTRGWFELAGDGFILERLEGWRTRRAAAGLEIGGVRIG